MATSSRRTAPAHRHRAARSARPPDPLLDLVIEEFLYACQQRLAEDTLRSYRGVLRVFTTYLHDQVGHAPTLGDFTLPVVQRWAMGLQQRPKQERAGVAVGDHPVAIETRRTYLRTLRTFSNWLPKPPHTFCDESPLRHLLLPRASDTFKLPLTDEEVESLLAAAREESVFGARDTAMLLVLIDGAVRAKELCQLRVGDVTLQTGMILVSRGKGNKTRSVTVGDETRLALRHHAVNRDSLPGVVRCPEEAFFQALHGGAFSYDGLRSWLRRITDRAGVPQAHLHL